MVKCFGGPHLLSRTMRGRSGRKLQRSQNLKSVRLSIDHHRVTKLNVKGLPILRSTEKFPKVNK